MPRGAPRGNRRAWKHGYYSAEMRTLRKELWTLLRITRYALGRRDRLGRLPRLAVWGQAPDKRSDQPDLQELRKALESHAASLVPPAESRK